MSAYEYRVIAAPRKGKSGKGVKGGAAKFANAITDLMNEMGAQGWEYLRADTLPCEERQGLTSKTVKYHSMLVFRRPSGTAATSDAAPLAIEHYEDQVDDYSDLQDPQSDELREEPPLTASEPEPQPEAAPETSEDPRQSA